MSTFSTIQRILMQRIPDTTRSLNIQGTRYVNTLRYNESLITRSLDIQEARYVNTLYDTKNLRYNKSLIQQSHSIYKELDYVNILYDTTNSYATNP